MRVAERQISRPGRGSDHRRRGAERKREARRIRWSAAAEEAARRRMRSSASPLSSGGRERTRPVKEADRTPDFPESREPESPDEPESPIPGDPAYEQAAAGSKSLGGAAQKEVVPKLPNLSEIETVRREGPSRSADEDEEELLRWSARLDFDAYLDSWVRMAATVDSAGREVGAT